MTRPSITIEFFGVPRRRVGVSRLELELSERTELSGILRRLHQQYPALDDICTQQGDLCSGYLVSVNGERFVDRVEEKITPGECLLLMSSDAGG